MRNLTPVFAFVFLLACGGEKFSHESDSIVNADRMLDSIAAADSTETFADLYGMLIKFTDSIAVPSRIDVDSFEGYKKISVTYREALALWPSNVEPPSEGEIYAFAQCRPENGTTGIWYYTSADAPEGNDPPQTAIFLVVYTNDSLPTDIYPLSLSGSGYSVSRMMSPTEFNVVDFEEMDNINVTSTYVYIENAHFHTGSEQRDAFTSDTAGYRKSQEYIRDILNNGINKP